MGIPPTGKRLEMTGIVIYRIEGGKITSDGHSTTRRTHAPDGRASVVGEYATSGICGTINGFRDDVTCRREARAREPRSRGGGDIGRLAPRQLNWRPDVTRWSVGQCVDHLLAANRLMFDAADEALRGAAPRTLWQRLPVLPGVCGRLLIRSQSPGGSRKFIAPNQGAARDQQHRGGYHSAFRRATP